MQFQRSAPWRQGSDQQPPGSNAPYGYYEQLPQSNNQDPYYSGYYQQAYAQYPGDAAAASTNQYSYPYGYDTQNPYYSQYNQHMPGTQQPQSTYAYNNYYYNQQTEAV